VLVFSGMASLAPPAHARETGWRGFGEITRSGLLGSVHKVLSRLFGYARGGMDPNGSPYGNG